MNTVIACFDIKDSSKIEKNEEKIQCRKQLYDFVKQNSETDLQLITESILDTGDGFYLIYNTCDYGKIIKSFEKMQNNSSNLKIRVRAALHIGSVESEESFEKKGYVGVGLDETARFVENNSLRNAINLNNTSNFIFGISDKLYAAVKNETWFDIQNYVCYAIKVKNFDGKFYLNKMSLSELPKQDDVETNNDKLKLTSTFAQFLTQSDFVYKNKSDITSDLETFFIYPELSVKDDDIKDPKKIKSELLLEDFISLPKNIIIYGSEQSGKTSLAKTFFKELFNSTIYLPVYIQFKENETGFIKNKLEKAISNQYELKSDTLRKVIILDDFHKVSAKTQSKILEDIKSITDTYCIIFVESEFQESIEREKLVKSFKHYSIRMLGHLKRNELIDKWIDFTNIENINYAANDELQEFINKTLLNGVIPYAPFYILTLLAAKEDLLPMDTEITSKGYCYQALILLAMKQMKINSQSEINVIQNFFGYIAFEMYKNHQTDYSEDELESIFNSFTNKYNWDIEYKKVLVLLHNNNIFTKNTLDLYSFKGVYFYYYFVARYISNKLTDSYYYNIAKNMVENLNEQDNGYIVIFLIHHTRSIILFDEVQLNAMLSYENEREIAINEDDTKRIDDSLKNLKEITLSAYDNSKENRNKESELIDKYEIDDTNNSHTETFTNQDINNEMFNMKKTLKTVEVLGQILKNHNGEIEKNKLEECLMSGMNAMKRLCSHLLSELDSCEKDFIDVLSSKLEERTESRTLSKAEKEQIIHQLISAISFSLMYTTVIGCGNALSSKELVNIVKTIYKKENSPIDFCIYVYCSLWYKKQFPMNELKNNFYKYPVAVQTIIRFIVKEYADMHQIDYKDKGKIAEVLGMKVSALKLDYSK